MAKLVASSNSAGAKGPGSSFPAKSATGGGYGTTQGGNLGSGGPSGDLSGVGAVGGKGVPPAGSGSDQIVNTAQQGFPAAYSAGGALVAALLENDTNALYEKISDITENYFAEFIRDRDYWLFSYKLRVRDFADLAVNTDPYYGDGRGRGNNPNSTDYDLFRRGQLAAQQIAQMDIAWRTKRRIVGRYSHGEMRMDDLDISIKRMQLQVDNQVIARKIEDIYEDEFNNRRWNRLLQAANIGIAGTAIAVQGMSTAMAGHMDALQGMANYKTALGNQVAAAAGNYIQSRGDG